MIVKSTISNKGSMNLVIFVIILPIQTINWYHCSWLIFNFYILSSLAFQMSFEFTILDSQFLVRHVIQVIRLIEYSQYEILAGSYYIGLTIFVVLNINILQNLVVGQVSTKYFFSVMRLDQFIIFRYQKQSGDMFESIILHMIFYFQIQNTDSCLLLDIQVKVGYHGIKQKFRESSSISSQLFNQFSHILERTIQNHTNNSFWTSIGVYKSGYRAHRSSPKNAIFNAFGLQKMFKYAFKTFGLINSQCDILAIAETTSQKIEETYIKIIFQQGFQIWEPLNA